MKANLMIKATKLGKVVVKKEYMKHEMWKLDIMGTTTITNVYTLISCTCLSYDIQTGWFLINVFPLLHITTCSSRESSFFLPCLLLLL